MFDVIHRQHADGAVQSQGIGRALKIAEEMESIAPDRMRAMLMALFSRIDIRPDCVEINVRIITAIVNGKSLPQLSAKRLMRLALELPVDWNQQRKLLGFQ